MARPFSNPHNMAQFSNIQASGPELPSLLGSINAVNENQSQIRNDENSRIQHQKNVEDFTFERDNRDAVHQFMGELDPTADDFESQLNDLDPRSFGIAGVSDQLKLKTAQRTKHVRGQIAARDAQESQNKVMRDIVKDTPPKFRMEMLRQQNAGDFEGANLTAMAGIKEAERLTALEEAKEDAKAVRKETVAATKVAASNVAKGDTKDIATINSQIVAADREVVAAKKQIVSDTNYNNSKEGKNQAPRKEGQRLLAEANKKRAALNPILEAARVKAGRTPKTTTAPAANPADVKDKARKGIINSVNNTI